MKEPPVEAPGSCDCLSQWRPIRRKQHRYKDPCGTQDGHLFEWGRRDFAFSLSTVINELKTSFQSWGSGLVHTRQAFHLASPPALV